ncbi:MAG: hypothetical protein IJ006_08550, partial [Lachnospiraceae bacterium]|nr:hypothetical protein [Lachnospiraceae bacterium]
WGAGYFLSCIGCVSAVAFVLIAVLYFVSIAWDKIWIFAEWIEVSVPVAGVIFVACLVIGTLIEMKALEAAYRRRECRTQPLLQAEENRR